MFAKFLSELPPAAFQKNPDKHSLDMLAFSLVSFAKSIDWEKLNLRKAIGNEELVHVLYETPAGPSLYIVSDAMGIKSEPHEHQTWAVIFGLQGRELNIEYELIGLATRLVRPIKEAVIDQMDVIAFTSNTIHATTSIGPGSTFHLHMYGLPLAELPSFASRCYTEIA